MKDVWRTSKKMIGIRKNQGIPTIIENGAKHTNNKDKANAIARCLAQNCSDDNFPEDFESRRRKAEADLEERQAAMERSESRAQ